MLNREVDKGVVRDIDSRLAIAILLALAALTAVLRLHSLAEPLSMNAAISSYVAHSMLEGTRLYTELWDSKPPGIFQLFMLSETLWGYGAKGVAYTALFFTLASLLFIFLFLKELVSQRFALVGAALWALSSNSILMHANEGSVELFINTFTIIALWSYLRSRVSTSGWYLLITGSSFALASLFKTTAVFPLIAVAVYAVFFHATAGRGEDARLPESARVKILLSLFAPGVILWTAVFLYFALYGRFPEFWQSLFVYNANYAGNILFNIWNFITSPVLFFHELYKDIWFLVLCALGWIFFSKKEYGSARLARGFFIILFIGIIVELSSPGKYFNHYYQLMLPLFSILGALFFAGLYERFSQSLPSAKKPLVAIIIFITFFNLAFYQVRYLSMTPFEISRVKHGEIAIDVIRMGEFVKANSRPCESIYVWGGEVGIYYYAKRGSASAIFNLYSLYFDSEEGIQNKIDRVYWDIIAKRPALFLRSLSFDTFGARALFDFVESRYRLVKSFDGVDVYELIDKEGRADCGTA